MANIGKCEKCGNQKYHGFGIGYFCFKCDKDFLEAASPLLRERLYEAIEKANEDIE